MALTPTRVALEHAAAGMQLAEDLCDARGQVLLPRGAILSDATLAALRARGVHELLMAAAPAPAGPDEDALAQERTRRQLARLFRKSTDAPQDRLLREAVGRYRQEHPA